MSSPKVRSLAASRRARRDGVLGALERWVVEAPAGADAVRLALARRLAAQLDAGEVPAYATAKVSSELRALLEEMEGHRRSEDPLESARRILAAVAQ